MRQLDSKSAAWVRGLREFHSLQLRTDKRDSAAARKQRHQIAEPIWVRNTCHNQPEDPLLALDMAITLYAIRKPQEVHKAHQLIVREKAREKMFSAGVH